MRISSLSSIVAGLVVLASSPALGAQASPSPSSTEPFPRCRDVPWITADPALYRDAPVYVANEMPTDEVRRWARRQPGFEELWIDRDHLGWITVGFSRDADARQREIERRFPDDGVVAVEVPHTQRELGQLQRSVNNALPEVADSFATSADVHRGVVDVSVGVLTDELIAFMAERFGGQPICLDGRDPSEVPAPGPQPQAGDGWRLLGAERGVGTSYRTGVAADAVTYASLWAESGLTNEAPAVDFEQEVAIWFGAVYGSSCPNLRLDDIVVDAERSLVYPLIVDVDASVFCTGDANPFAFMVALERSRLPAGGFTVQLGPGDPPVGAPEERTVVDADLSQPGAVPGPGEVHLDLEHPGPRPLQSGAVVEPGVPMPYRMDVSCGIEWLGEVNGIDWRQEPASGGAEVPAAWQQLVSSDGQVEVEIQLDLEPEPRIRARAMGHSVDYAPNTAGEPACHPG